VLRAGHIVYARPTESVTQMIRFGPRYVLLSECFFEEHAPPHFHAQYGEYKASINIQTLDVADGKLPRRALNLVLDWAELHQDEWLNDWDKCRLHHEPSKIKPLP
jgi:hypothetical protein